MGFFRNYSVFYFTRRKPHSRVWTKANRFLTGLPATANGRLVWLALLQQLTEAVKINIRKLFPVTGN
ncbi:hypothetical protein ECDEC6B_5649 [Escherichia coli DEC6B]|nr:hypothetical protein ECDEC6B_5649 [Escherichia coli DEC6B]